MKTKLMAAAALVAGLVFGAQQMASAAIVIFDDTAKAPFGLPWFTGTQNANVHSGLWATKTSNGQTVFSSTVGISVGSHQVLEFYINTSDASAATGTYLMLDYDNKTLIPFDQRNVPTTFTIDGVLTTWVLGVGIATDADPATWQKVQIDLFQKTYTGHPYIEHQLTSTSILKTINIRGGDTDLLIDDVRLVTVPEPTSLAILGLLAATGTPRRRW